MVEWPDIDEDIFTSFWQYIYTGDYTLPKDVYSPRPETPSTVSKDGRFRSAIMKGTRYCRHCDFRLPDWDSAFCNDCGHEQYEEPTGRARLWYRFQSITSSEACPPGASEHEDGTDHLAQDAGAVLVHHARLHVLGDYCGLDGLERLSRHKVYRLLESLGPRHKNPQDIIPVLQYCHTTEATSNLEAAVAAFAAYYAEELWQHREFQDVIRAGGDVACLVMESTIPGLS